MRQEDLRGMHALQAHEKILSGVDGGCVQRLGKIEVGGAAAAAGPARESQMSKLPWLSVIGEISSHIAAQHRLVAREIRLCPDLPLLLIRQLAQGQALCATLSDGAAQLVVGMVKRPEFLRYLGVEGAAEVKGTARQREGEVAQIPGLLLGKSEQIRPAAMKKPALTEQEVA
ncbi:hypothetical protein SAZ10_21150 [Mesorhizobium sp. BAC0120]|uniref:hypothetical protein n=1 Tax=Mesorhizobium sp. BAC0120 TaxID=3090670 RepID=UPI00298BF33A|nr:hypothetical protein [Mesorhizobium sp. BAC0120]MDW6024261.1 hypothetical protein [Mesorhizobium sp. BAC0120]